MSTPIQCLYVFGLHPGTSGRSRRVNILIAAAISWSISTFADTSAWAREVMNPEEPLKEILDLSNAPPPPLRIAAVSDHNPGECRPSCREGYTCQSRHCVSVCNPACPSGERCLPSGVCDPIPKAGRPARRDYLAVIGGVRLGLSDPARHSGDVRLEFGGPHLGVQLGPHFGKSIAAGIRTAVLGHIPFQITRSQPLFLEPMIHLGYAFNWLNSTDSRRQHDFFITPGLRLRYDILPRLALFVDLIQVEIAFLRLEDSDRQSIQRVDAVPVFWGMHSGLAWLY